MVDSCDNCQANTGLAECRFHVTRPDTTFFSCSRHSPKPQAEPLDIGLLRERTLAIVHGSIDAYRFCTDTPILIDKLNSIIGCTMGLYRDVKGKPWGQR